MNQDLKKALDAVIAAKSEISTDTGRHRLDALMAEAITFARTPEEKKEAGQYLLHGMKASLIRRPDVPTKQILEECAEAINLSYIAKRYFNRDRSWLSQRINGSIVNGKPAAFTEDELRILSESLADIGSIISKTSSLIHSNL